MSNIQSQVVETEKYRIRRSFFDAETSRVYGALRDIPRRLHPEPSAISAALRIGYVPGTATLFKSVALLPGGCKIRPHSSGWSVHSRFRFADVVAPAELRRRHARELAGQAAEMFRRAVRRGFNAGDEPVVPLSGGIDSRAILAALLECTEPKRIKTYTYGVPGSLDFKIGNAVAAAAGTDHTTIDMRDVSFTREGLLETARLCDGNTTILHPFVWTEVIRRFGETARFWSGFTGDGIGGSHYLPPGTSAGRAVSAYVQHESGLHRYFEGQVGTAETESLVPDRNKYEEVLSPEEAVWFENHVERYTAHQIFMAGLDYVVPFMDDELVTFFFSISPELRRGKVLFNEAMRSLDERLFRLPTVDYGYRLAGSQVRHWAWRARLIGKKIGYRIAPQWCVHPGTTYVDFSVGFRFQPELRQIARGALDSLVRRDILSRSRIESLWTAHDRGDFLLINTILGLVSLELTLQAFSDEGVAADVA